MVSFKFRIKNRLIFVKTGIEAYYYTRIKKSSIFSRFYQKLDQKIPPYTLPNLLQPFNRKPIMNRELWEKYGRPEILSFYKKYVYGWIPESAFSQITKTYAVISESVRESNPAILERQVELNYSGPLGTYKIYFLVFLPRDSLMKKKEIPMFVGLNFHGNHTLTKTKNIVISPKTKLVRRSEKRYKQRNAKAYRWPVDLLIANGYGLITAFYGDFYPDLPQGRFHSIYNILPEFKVNFEPGALAAWAYGFSELINYIQKELSEHYSEVYTIGHSRLGKTALWATACDKRITGVFANNSGCLGAALSNRWLGETLNAIRIYFPFWFTRSFLSISLKDLNRKIDQHFLLALIAPRKLYVISAHRDIWADPIGEFLGLKHALPVFQLYNPSIPSLQDFPVLNQPIHQYVGYHIRPGIHEVTYKTWVYMLEYLMKFKQKYE